VVANIADGTRAEFLVAGLNTNGGELEIDFLPPVQGVLAVGVEAIIFA